MNRLHSFADAIEKQIETLDFSAIWAETGKEFFT